MAKDVFISYSSDDAEVVGRICSLLETGGCSCWIAPRDVRYGHDYKEEIIDALEQARALVLILSSRSNKSDHVNTELEIAFRSRKMVYPIRIENVLPSKKIDYFICTKQWVDAWEEPLEIKVDKLVENILAHLAISANSPDCALTLPAPEKRGGSSSEGTEVRGSANTGDTSTTRAGRKPLILAAGALVLAFGIAMVGYSGSHRSPDASAQINNAHMNGSKASGSQGDGAPDIRSDAKLPVASVGIPPAVSIAREKGKEALTILDDGEMETTKRQMEPVPPPAKQADKPGMEKNPGAPSVRSKAWVESLTGMVFVPIKAGCFEMGDAGEPDNVEGVHQVCVEDFYMGRYEVTQAQWKKVMGEGGSYFKECGEDCPVDNVSWNEAQNYIDRLNRQTRGRYRLPTEAEWEYAARSGGKRQPWPGTANRSELQKFAWYKGSSERRTHPVGQLNPNGLGLYDMAGNVWEWVNDGHDRLRLENGGRDNRGGLAQTRREMVFRGGSWYNDCDLVSTSYRASAAASDRGSVSGCRGFRLAFPAR